MRILHVVDSLEPGGMENGVVNLINGLAPSFDGHVACLTRRGAFAERVRQPELVVSLGKSSRFTPSVVWRLAREIRRVRPSLIHTHNLGPLIYAALATLGGRTCPILHGEHSLLTASENWPAKLRQRRNLFRTCRAVHTVAPAIRDQLIELRCDHPRLQVIPNGVDTGRFTPGDRRAARQAMRLPDAGLVVGLVGRFGPHKGHTLLIEAFEKVVQTHPRCHLLLVGGGGPCEADVRERAAASSACDLIRFTGFMPDPLPAYRAIDLLVIPSTNEGMANAALEAMACSLPVLANTGCGHEEFMKDGEEGVISDLRDPRALASEINRLLDCPTRLVELGERARIKVGASFSIEAMMAAYTCLYRSLDRP